MSSSNSAIYKIVTETQWNRVLQDGEFRGAPVDLRDGYIHFSTASQVRETAAKHFSGQDDLLLVSVDPRMLGDALKYETSRNDELFPHLYGTLCMGAVIEVVPLPIGEDGQHEFPDLS